MTSPHKRALLALVIPLAMVLSGLGIILAPAFAPTSAPAVVQPQKAAASAFFITNHLHSDYAINVYSHSGCSNHRQNLSPGEESTTIHDWKTFWLRKHHKAEITAFGSPYHYTIHNTHSYDECRDLGHFFWPAGWIVRVYHD